MAMQSPEARFLEAVFNHVSLPPRLPGRQEGNLDRIDRALVERVLDAVARLSPILANNALEPLRRSLQVCKHVNTGGRLAKSSLLTAFRELPVNPTDFLLLHVAEQNVALIVRCQKEDEHGEEIVFEAFEASPVSEDVLAAEGALQWDFPGNAVAIPLDTFNDPKFQEELATFLEKASVESIKRFAARANKAGSSAYESRGTADPSLITQMLMSLLAEIGGRRVFPTLLRKHVRDDVLWENGSEKPWRRSPFWLALRVSIHRHLSQSRDSGIGRAQYKFMMCLVFSKLLDDCVPHISLELSNHLKAKLCRRLVKLQDDRDGSVSPLDTQYAAFFSGLGPELRHSVNSATEKINVAWERYTKRMERRTMSLPQRALDIDLRLSLRNSGDYLRKLVYNNSYSQYAVSRTTSNQGLPRDYLSSARVSKSGSVYVKRYFLLSEAEMDIENQLNDTSNSESDPEKHCSHLARTIGSYLDKVGDSYDRNPEQKSLMILYVMGLWVAMDSSAIKACSLLKDYSPGFPVDILDVLHVARRKDMLRLQKIRKYLQMRHRACKGHSTIFNDPAKGCFAERYYNESDSKYKMQALNERIEEDAKSLRMRKEQEWCRKSLEFEALVEQAADSSCLFTVDEYQVRVHNGHQCTKCFLERTIKRFSMSCFEHPLPSDPILAKVVVFELSCPKAIRLYRDLTWRILSTLALTRTPTPGSKPLVMLKDYSELTEYSRSIPSADKFSLASMTKSWLITHYSKCRFPIGLEEVCKSNGLKLKYYDERLESWTGGLSMQRPSFAQHCRMTVPPDSPFSIFNFSSQFDASSNGPSSYEIIASQTKCPSGLNVHEFLSFQTLFAGRTRRWLQLLIELGSSNINFSTEGATSLISYLALQAGGEEQGSFLGTIHGVFEDAAFCNRLLEQLDQRIDAISTNWRDTNCMESLITIGLRLFELGTVSMEAVVMFLEKARLITTAWMSTLQTESRLATDAVTVRRCSKYALLAALLCRRTFCIYLNPLATLDPAALKCFFESSIVVQDNMGIDPPSLPLPVRHALIRDIKATSEMRHQLRSSVDKNQDSLIKALSGVLPGASDYQDQKLAGFQFLPEPNEWWVEIKHQPSILTQAQVVHFNLLEGHLLVMGKPVGKLPQEWKDSAVIQTLFRDQNLQTFSSPLPGMTYMLLRQPVYGCEVHLGIRNGTYIVQTRMGDAVSEYIPKEIFGDAQDFDLPAELVDDSVHWLDLRTGMLEIRASATPWKQRLNNWYLNTKTCQATRGKWALVDPRGRLFPLIAEQFLYFEDRRHITVTQPLPVGRLTVNLRRLDLLFYVNARSHLECPQLHSEIDFNQDCGTLYGLSSKLVLKEIGKTRHPAGYMVPIPLQQRSVLVPMGQITTQRSGPHVKIIIQNSGDYVRLLVNETLGRLDCAAEPLLLYLKAMYHAYTSFVIPDPLTGRTGTEEALHCLRSGYCQPWSPLSFGSYKALTWISKLTPHREYYPSDLKVMQKVHWNDTLTVTIQNDGYQAIIGSILQISHQLSMFTTNTTAYPPLDSAGSSQLVLRNRLRRQLYQRPMDADDTKGIPAQPYSSRDLMLATGGRENVIECTNLILSWPTSFETTKDLSGLIQAWPSFRGFNGSFSHALLSDVLDVQMESDWGPLANMCLLSSKDDLYRLIFLFGTISFRSDANMDAIRTLIAFAVFTDLKSISTPQWPMYAQFRNTYKPRVDSTTKLFKSCLVPYERGDTLGIGMSFKLRKKHDKSEQAHTRQQERDATTLAEFLLKQWPCVEPTVAGFDTPILVDIQQALEVIRPEWLRLYQNLDLADYLAQVQIVLDKHSAKREASTSPFVEVVEQEVYPTRIYGHGLVPNLGQMFQMTLSVPKLNMPLIEIPPLVPVESRLQLPYLAESVKPYDEIKQLHRIIEIAVHSKSVFERQYGEDLARSLIALQHHNQNAPKQRQGQVDKHLLGVAIARTKLLVRHRLQHIQEILGDNQYAKACWLKQGYLWPSTHPVSTLETLRSVSNLALPDKVRSVIIEYALSITSLQRLHRLEEAILKENMQRLREEEQNEGHTNWNPAEHPDWLLLEIDCNVLIRPGQVEVAFATISPATNSNSVLQMNMGQGKTACIIPMTAAVLANGTNILRVIVPKPLLLQTAQLLHARLGGLVGRELRHIPFSRKTPTNAATIQAFLNIHKDMQQSSGVVIALPEHLLSFLLSGIQRLSDGRNQEATNMIKVQNWLLRRTRDVIDECDSILALRTQLIYPSGSQKVVDGHPLRWEVAEVLLSLVDGHLYNLQVTFPRSLEVVRRDKGGFPAIFFLRKDVEVALIERLVDDIYRGRTSIFPSNCTKSDRLIIKQFISEGKISENTSEHVSKMFNDKPAYRNAIYLLRGLLVHRILLMTLKRRWNVQYGLHPARDPIAVPYHAKGTPSEQAEWGHPDVAILFTCLAFYYDGLTVAHLRQALEHVLKSDDPTQVYDRFSQTSDLPDSLRDWNSINLDDEVQLTEIWRHVRFNVVVVDYFLNNFVFPRHAKQFQVKLQASGWDIPLFSAKAQEDALDRNEQKTKKPSGQLTTGFSGTNDGKGMLPLTIRQQDLQGLSHTNAEVLTYLLAPRNREYIQAADGDGKHISEYRLLEKISDARIRVLIDAGAQILEMDNSTLAKAWLEIVPKAAAAVYFDTTSKPQVIYRNKTGSPIPLLATPFADDLSECLVYIDEAHTRGTDLKLPIHARGALTLGLGQTKDHTVQAAMRLRQLGTTQSIAFFAPPEVTHSILDLSDKQPGDRLDSYDVVRWLLEQTCRGMEQLQPLYFSQGTDFCKRTQAALDHPDHLKNSDQREKYLGCLQQIEQQTLEQLYGYTGMGKSSVSLDKLSPEVKTFMKELMSKRRGFQDTGDAVHASALQEVEQEREVAYEIEAVREVQKQVHYPAMDFPGLHGDITSFARSGRKIGRTCAYELAFTAMRRFSVGKKFRVDSDETSGKLYVSAEFMKTVHTKSGGTAYDNFQRNVHWILWSPTADIAMVVIPEEAEILLRIVKEPDSAAYLLVYAAPVTRKMLHFNDFKYFATPALPSAWEPPSWLRTELGIFSGRLYFEYSEYSSILSFLGVREGSSRIKEEEDEDDDADADVFEKEVVRIEGSGESVAEPKPKIFARKPLMFLQEWLAMRRKGQDFSETPMGFICQGKQLLESHSFFGRLDNSGGKRALAVKTRAVVDEDEDEDDDHEVYDVAYYGPVREEDDTFDYATLEDNEVDAEDE